MTDAKPEDRSVPVTAQSLAELTATMPPVVQRILDFTLAMLEGGHLVDSLVIERQGVMGATNFNWIAHDKSGDALLLSRLALTRLEATSAAAATEATSTRSDTGVKTDGIVVQWWSAGEERTWVFGVDGMGPGPRTLLLLDEPLQTLSRFAGLLVPLHIEELPARHRNGLRKRVDRLLVVLRPLVAGSIAKGAHAQPHRTVQ